MPTFRCPYCHGLFTELARRACPHCGRTPLMPASPRRAKARASNHSAPSRRPPTHPLGLLFHNGFKMTAAILILLAAGSALLSRARTPPVDSLPRKLERTRQSLATLRVAVELFRLDTGRYPTTEEGLAALVVSPEGLEHWDGPYIVVLKNDLWGRPFRYWLDGSVPRLAADGPDGERETADDLIVAEEKTRIEFPAGGGIRAIIAFADGLQQAIVDETLPSPRSIRAQILRDSSLSP